MPRLPLHEAHASQGAAFQETAGWTVPTHYGDPAVECRAVRKAAGLVDASHEGKVRLTGEDRAAFLHNVTSNDVKALQPGQGHYSTILTAKGRIQADLVIYCLPGALWLALAPERTAWVPAFLEKYHFSEKVSFEDVTPQYALIGLHGPRAHEVLSRAAGGEPIHPLPPFFHQQCRMGRLDVWLCGRDRTGEQGYDLYITAAESQGLWDLLRKAGENMGLRPVGWQAMETLRIEAGIPRYGRELTDEHFPAEAGITDQAVSYTKGCYLGQETTARIRTYGGVKRLLVGLRVEDNAPKPGSLLRADGQEVGAITSAAFSHTLNQAVALAYVKRNLAEPGSTLLVEQQRATIVLVRSSE